jgi:peptide/nickel transport system substrate-binding protein
MPNENHPDKAPKKRISRRGFVRLAGVATGGLLLAACAPEPAELPEEPTAPAAVDTPADPTPEAEERTPADVSTLEPEVEEAPGYGGRLRWASRRSPEGFFDPNLATGIQSYYAGWVYEPLVSIDEEYANLIPRLAVSWQPEDEGRAWVFDLREGVRFHNGREFVADDVVHTFERILDPDFGSPARPVFENISQVEALDAHSVRFRLSVRNSDFPFNLTTFQAKITPHDLTDEEINRAPRGTGPFSIERYAHADRIIFQRNEDYWEKGRPYLDELEAITIPEATTLINTLQAGGIDVVSLLPAPSLPIVEADPNLDVSFGPAIDKNYIYMRLDVEPFTDDRVRRAFKLIPDREAMTELVWEGFPALSDDDNPVIPTSPWRAETDIWRQDLDEARRLLEDAGYGDGLELDLWVINDEYGVMEFSLAFADWAAQAGVQINIEGVPQDRFYAEKWLEVPLGTVGWSARTTVDEQLRLAYTSDAPWNETRYQSEEFDAMLDEALAETDVDRRKELYEEIQRKLITDGGQIIHTHHPRGAAVRKNVHGYKFHPLDYFDPRNVWLS